VKVKVRSGREIKKLGNWKIEKCRIRVRKIIFGIMKDGLGRLAQTLLYQKYGRQSLIF
jgi:hypothetical protein